MSTQKFDYRGRKVLWAGKSGTGKTTHFVGTLQEEKARWKFVFDHQAEFGPRFKLPVVCDRAGIESAVEKGGWVIFDPSELFPGRLQEGFEFFCEYVFEVCRAAKGRKILACDELQKLIDVNKKPEALLAIVETGRRHQLDFFAITNRPSGLHNAVRNQFTEAFIFKLTSARQLKVMEEDFECDPEKIRALDKDRGEFFHVDIDGGEVLGTGFVFPAHAKGKPSPEPAA